ncbi:hypothetical protein Scep_017626 [Stephania cephalantha]|uniref:Uncharacterized protein n=1 Tax=Stephania cephalantha TaxID=152367 RepID=A0AAP0IPU9_9MAGN
MVQMLKQILHAEEEMKKRNSMPAAVVRSPNPSQVETMNDAGATPKHAINRMGSEGNSSGDLEGESEDASNHTAHARHRQQMSPSTSSPLRRPSHGSLQHNAVPHSTRPSLGASGHGQTTSTHMGVTASPSRFAPFGHQSHSAGLPPLAISGTPFTASSPSPAGSGGSSVFRDPRWTSPTWN